MLGKKFTKKLVKEYIKKMMPDTNEKNLIFKKCPPSIHSNGCWYWRVYDKVFPYSKTNFDFCIDDSNIVVRINQVD